MNKQNEEILVQNNWEQAAINRSNLLVLIVFMICYQCTNSLLFGQGWLKVNPKN